MLDALPALVAPGPFAAFGAEHEEHHDIDQRNKHQERDPGVVADAPDPVEQHRAPVPAPDLGRDDGGLALSGRVFHVRLSPGYLFRSEPMRRSTRNYGGKAHARNFGSRAVALHQAAEIPGM